MKESKLQRSAREKFNYQAYRKMGYTPALARKYRGRSPITTMKIASYKDISLHKIKVPHVKVSHKQKEVLGRFLVEEIGFSKAQAGRLKKLKLSKIFNITKNAEVILKGAKLRGMSKKEVKEQLASMLTDRTEKGFWKALSIFYRDFSLIRP